LELGKIIREQQEEIADLRYDRDTDDDYEEDDD